MSFREKARDLAIETLIAIVLVTAYVIYLFKVPRDRTPDSWITALAVNTAIVFGFLLSWFRRKWKIAQFWITLALLLFCHLAVFIFLLRRAERIPLATYILTNTIELAIFLRILWKLPDLSSGPD